MNEKHGIWTRWAEESSRQCESQLSDSRIHEGRMETSTAELHCGSANTTKATDSAEEKCSGMQTAMLELERSFESCNHNGEAANIESTSSGRLGASFSEQAEFDTPAEDERKIKATMTVSAFVRLVNECGFGEVLTERQLLRQRRAFPRVDACRGLVDVIAYLASICSRRRRALREGDIRVSDLAEMLEKQRYRCALSGERLTSDNVALDHIVPVSEGGGFTVENSQLVTKAVNRAKHTMAQNDFVKLCESVAENRAKNIRLLDGVYGMFRSDSQVGEIGASL
jgi:5-methylcytosine-specific restriction endonuclease McrA